MPKMIPIAPLEGYERFAIVVAEWNRAVTDNLLEGAVAAFAEHGVADDRIDVAWVPGSWEIPLAAKLMAHSGEYAAA